jgi:cyclic beta-1,2-glucan synthetase
MSTRSRPHVGRGGWTWYTGSAGWMYRLLVETLLGLNLEGEELRFEPRLPGAWPACRFRYRYRATTYHLHVFRLDPASTVTPGLSLDGIDLPSHRVPLRDDGRDHTVVLRLRP